MVKAEKDCDEVSDEEKIELKPIGFVKTKTVGKKVRNRSNVSQIVFRENLTEALDGIQDFSNLFVIFCNKISTPFNRVLASHYYENSTQTLSH